MLDAMVENGLKVELGKGLKFQVKKQRDKHWNLGWNLNFRLWSHAQ